jgi:hypothetical protein
MSADERAALDQSVGVVRHAIAQLDKARLK